MKESIWLKNYEQEVKGKRDASNGKKKIILIMVPLIMLLFMAAAMMNADSAAAQGQNPAMYFVPLFVVLMVFIVIMLSIGKKKDVTKHTRENVKALLRNDAEVEQFDRQMSEAPIKEVKISGDTTIFLTLDYVGKKCIAMGDLTYTFIRREEMAYYDYAKTASTTANPLNAAYFFDIRNAQKKVILNGLADSGSQLGQLEELLKLAQPAIQKK